MGGNSTLARPVLNDLVPEPDFLGLLFYTDAMQFDLPSKWITDVRRELGVDEWVVWVFRYVENPSKGVWVYEYWTPGGVVRLVRLEGERWEPEDASRVEALRVSGVEVASFGRGEVLLPVPVPLVEEAVDYHIGQLELLREVVG